MPEAFQDPAPSARRGRATAGGSSALSYSRKAGLGSRVPASPCCGLLWGLDFTCSKKRVCSHSWRSHPALGRVLVRGAEEGRQQPQAASPAHSPPPGLGFGMLRAPEQLGSWAVREGSASPCRAAPRSAGQEAEP